MADTPLDDEILTGIAAALQSQAGGLGGLKGHVGQILRDCIDSVIQTPKTGRRLYNDLQNSEKTYIGTRVEIDLREVLKFRRGKQLDFEIAGNEVDLKFSAGVSWMIPPEAIGHPCIVISANDTKGECCFGLFVANAEYLNAPNRDQKRSISRFGRDNIRWLFKDQPYPPNFWQTVTQETAERIAAGESGNERVITLFREVVDRPISRKVVEDVAAQRDFMRRVRSDRGGGTRDILAQDSIVLLSGTWTRAQELIKLLRLPPLSKSEFMSHRVTAEELTIARRLGCL